MNLGRKISVTVGIQALGVVATAAANIIISHQYGPKGQGYLIYVKSIVDLLSGIAIFGFPQSFIYMINAQLVQTSWVASFALQYAMMCSVLSILVAYVAVISNIALHNGLDTLACLSIYISFIGTLIYGLFRCISITKNSIYLYNVVTVFPSVTVACIYLLYKADNYYHATLILSVSSVLSAVLSYMVVNEKILLFKPKHIKQHIDTITKAVSYSFWSFIPTISFSLVVSLTYFLIRRQSLDEVNIGYFSVSLLLLSTSVVPLSMVGPVLFDEWSRSTNKSEIEESYTKLSRLGILIIPTVLLFNSIAAKPLTNLLFGNSYQSSIEVTKILLLSSYLLYQSRLISSLLLAYGKHQVVAIGAIIRTFVILMLLIIFSKSSITKIAWIWNAGEACSTFYLAWILKSTTRWSMGAIIGLSPKWLRSLIPK